MINSPYATQRTNYQVGGREPSRSMKNKKPFRTIRQKVVARKAAEKVETGQFISPSPVSYH